MRITGGSAILTHRGFRGVFAAAALIALLPSAAEAAAKPLAVRVETGTQAKALRANSLKVRVVARRATRVKLSAVVGKKGVVRPATVSLRRGKGRTVSLRLNDHGRRSFAACADQRVTVVASDLRNRRSKARAEPIAPARPRPLPPRRPRGASRLRGGRRRRRRVALLQRHARRSPRAAPGEVDRHGQRRGAGRRLEDEDAGRGRDPLDSGGGRRLRVHRRPTSATSTR